MHTSVLTNGLLAAIALVTPVVTAAGTATCGTNNKIDSWVVSKLNFHSVEYFSTSDKKTFQGSMSFTLTNPIHFYQITCNGASKNRQDFYSGAAEYHCTIPDGVPKIGNAASFSFDKDASTIRLSQTWTCSDTGARFVAKGDGRLPLKCDEERWDNPEWKEGELFALVDTDCNVNSGEVPISEIAGVL